MQYFTLPPELMNYAICLNRDLVTRSDDFSLTVARIMAYRAKITCEQTSDEAARNAVGQEFDSLVSNLNNLFALDIIKVREYTKIWTKWRHDQLTGCLNAPYGREGTEVEDYLGISKYFDTNTLKNIRECPGKYTDYHTKLVKFIEHMDATKDEASISIRD